MNVTQEERDLLEHLLENLRNAITARTTADKALDDFIAEHEERVAELRNEVHVCREIEVAALRAWNMTAPALTLRVMDVLLSKQVTP